VVIEIKGEIIDKALKNLEKQQTIEEKYKFKDGRISLSTNHIAFSNVLINEVYLKSVEVYNHSDSLIILSIKDLPNI